MMRRVSVLMVCGALVGATSMAGPITPPPGPVSPTPGPEPRVAINATNTPGDNDSTPSVFKITAPGSYYLTGNVTGADGKAGIEILASNVTVDLNGFAMLGTAGSDSGIVMEGGFVGVRIRNGVISGWGDDGVTLQFGSGSATLIEDLLVTGNANVGINSAGSAIVRGCVVRGNGEVGISAGSGCQVIECTSIDNGGTGIFVAAESIVANCASILNDADGIYLASGSHASNNSVSQNGLHGIFVSGEGLATGNFCGSNGRLGAGAGITAGGSNSRIEGNTCIENDWGVRVTSSGNFIARNIASSNTTANWNVVAGNACYVVQTLPAPAINGSSGGISPGSTDPNANYTY